MRNNRNFQTAAAESSVMFASGSRNGLPPVSSIFTDEDFFENDEPSFDVLAPFDYEAFLRREGLV